MRLFKNTDVVLFIHGIGTPPFWEGKFCYPFIYIVKIYSNFAKCRFTLGPQKWETQSSPLTFTSQR